MGVEDNIKWKIVNGKEEYGMIGKIIVTRNIVLYSICKSE